MRTVEQNSIKVDGKKKCYDTCITLLHQLTLYQFNLKSKYSKFVEYKALYKTFKTAELNQCSKLMSF